MATLTDVLAERLSRSGLPSHYLRLLIPDLADALGPVIEAAKAEAWDEGAVVGDAYGMDAISLNPMHANPYRAARGGES